MMGFGILNCQTTFYAQLNYLVKKLIYPAFYIIKSISLYKMSLL